MANLNGVLLAKKKTIYPSFTDVSFTMLTYGKKFFGCHSVSYHVVITVWPLQRLAS